MNGRERLAGRVTESKDRAQSPATGEVWRAYERTLKEKKCWNHIESFVHQPCFCFSESPRRLTHGRGNRRNKKETLSPRNSSNRDLSNKLAPRNNSNRNLSNRNRSSKLGPHNSSNRKCSGKLGPHNNSNRNRSSKLGPHNNSNRNRSNKPEGSRVS